ncbi:hypothetical protein [Galactobacter valiniphilus]
MQRTSFAKNPGFKPASFGLPAAVRELAEPLDFQGSQHRSMGHQS